MPAPRIGLRQGDSIRPIDDFSVYGHNGTSGSVESPASGGVDEIAALIKAFATAVDERCVSRPGCGPEVAKVPVCRQYQPKSAGAVVGRTLDLSKAYKNLAPAPAFFFVPRHGALAPAPQVRRVLSPAGDALRS